MSSLTYPAAALGLALVTWAASSASRRNRHDINAYPPGPSGLPLLGNVYQIDGMAPWMTFTEWKDTYGDVVYCRQLGTELVILSSEEAARDLLDKRSSNYSDRMHMAMMEPYGFKYNTVFILHDDIWRLHRRIAHHSLREHHVNMFRPTQLRFSDVLLENLAANPDKYHDHFQRFSGSVVLSATFDHDVVDNDDLLTRVVTDTTSLTNRLTSPGNTVLMNFLPILQYVPTWVPGGWRNAAAARKKTERMLNLPFELLNAKIVSGMAGHSIALDALEGLEETNKVDNFEEVVKGACMTLYAAGEETVFLSNARRDHLTDIDFKTASTMMVFLLAMCRNPDAQRRAQQEIDAVIGADRLPDYNDRGLLPYVEAVYREVLRWYPVAPLGIPHASTNDDVYGDWFIPKGSTIIANVWAMSHNPAKYPEPSAFKPERFLDAHGQLTDDNVSYIWGFGRRICPGRHFATNSVWIAIVRMLAAFRFEFQSEFERAGADVKWINSITSVPAPFPCRIVQRQNTTHDL
ncbi:cytochrome P450 [Coniophora puteana RWD-64-598 SS2]|uniref:Cytochrome P450 n=1 Tax=Coniophora puteana (strain RWD-64-598) TaxID=741705 RepID=A0A5M3MZA4_CONPW|nr:cytochrome P450 [Coniophora puteana RWD-64-598 SS2]EIW84503.1 cytochrome P450 [Coniophora puteana RWD-64-598 SS2]